MKTAELLRSSSFRLSLVYMVLFAGSVLLLLGFLYWQTVGYMAEQTDATIEAEITGLAEQYRERGLNGLVTTITERLERDPDSSSVYLFALPDYTPLAGNLSAWPEVPATPDGWLNFQFKKCPACNSRRSNFLLWVKPKNDSPFSAYECRKCNEYFAIYEGQTILRSEFKWSEHSVWNHK